jgi:hypothetical protein
MKNDYGTGNLLIASLYLQLHTMEVLTILVTGGEQQGE